jgi:hypothetical protein
MESFEIKAEQPEPVESIKRRSIILKKQLYESYVENKEPPSRQWWILACILTVVVAGVAIFTRSLIVFGVLTGVGIYVGWPIIRGLRSTLVPEAGARRSYTSTHGPVKPNMKTQPVVLNTDDGKKLKPLNHLNELQVSPQADFRGGEHWVDRVEKGYETIYKRVLSKDNRLVYPPVTALNKLRQALFSNPNTKKIP